MSILVDQTAKHVGARNAVFQGNTLHLQLTDGRELVLPIDQIPWLHWLCNATPEEQAKWSLEPGGYAIYWEDLDDGFEIAHALSLEPVA